MLVRMSSLTVAVVVVGFAAVLRPSSASAFVPPCTFTGARAPSCLFSVSDALPEISSMKAGDMKRELESYGVSTITFLEKSEYVAALEEARAAGMTSVNTNKSKKKKKKRSPSSSTESSATNQSRGELISAELEKLKTMKATEMKKELEERGISTKSFFEKSEFMMALADARVDGVTKVAGGGGGKSSGGEGYAEYKADDVEVITNDSAGPRKRSQQEEGQGQQVGNPFGGGGMPGGMGGMGGIADMLKNMGMDGAGGGGGTSGANPFGGKGGSTPFGGANPFSGGMGGGMGDAFGKAQEMMKNPKLMELVSKAQSNPKIMAAMTECMSNPAAMSKYINDPEVGPFMKEFQQYM